MPKHASQSASDSKDLDSMLRKAAKGERTVVRRRNKPVAAVVPFDDFEFLERVEDRFDIEEARKRLDEPNIPWEQVKKELGL
jgi:antitoxin (DNA-binding transcriptional repressor) of toxin-antitoxin stability system